MYVSEILRDIILTSRNFLEIARPFFWDENFLNSLKDTKIDDCNITDKYKEKIVTLHDVFLKGLNYGKCGLTTRYLLQHFDSIDKYSAKLCYGVCSLLKDTKNSPNGKHAFIEYNGYMYCTTLMLKLPVANIDNFGYKINKIINIESSRIISEYQKF